ncbi:MAG: hypothetical protein A2Z47_01400 [Thermodesulfovibrio sp. RBG_19FT_COMBO_42_12]|nr:MAG: hypothetical protein A2Z47_01400 [Thermodesulfovibrio sp. RBG_19FT_COMBO_42_12]
MAAAYASLFAQQEQYHSEKEKRCSHEERFFDPAIHRNTCGRGDSCSYRHRVSQRSLSAYSRAKESDTAILRGITTRTQASHFRQFTPPAKKQLNCLKLLFNTGTNMYIDRKLLCMGSGSRVELLETLWRKWESPIFKKYE